MGLSLSHLILVLVVVILVFGTKRLPEIMRDLAKGYRAFTDGLAAKSPPTDSSAAAQPPYQGSTEPHGQAFGHHETVHKTSFDDSRCSTVIQPAAHSPAAHSPADHRQLLDHPVHTNCKSQESETSSSVEPS